MSSPPETEALANLNASLHQAAYVCAERPVAVVLFLRLALLHIDPMLACKSSLVISGEASTADRMSTAYAGEVPLCDTSNSKCIINDPAKHPDLFCTTDTASPTNCQRYQEFHSLYSRGTDQHTRDLSHAQEKSNSVVFNCFIFFQVCLCCLMQKLHEWMVQPSSSAQSCSQMHSQHEKLLQPS